MEESEYIKAWTKRSWEIEGISLSHNVIEYNELTTLSASNESDSVRLHFGLRGGYHFNYKQIDRSFSLSGHHNNIMYSDGLDLEITNHSHRIETFGVNFTPQSFVAIGQKGNELLKRFTERVCQGESSILSSNWRGNTFRTQEVISDILSSNFQEGLREIFLFAKSVELLVLLAEQHSLQRQGSILLRDQDRIKLVEAKEIIEKRIENPPSLAELSNLVLLNEYKLKKGFKSMFGTTVFGHMQNCRLSLAKQLLLNTDKTAKEIAYEIGYGSPQHFSQAFKKTFGVTPKSIRINPDSAISDTRST